MMRTSLPLGRGNAAAASGDVNTIAAVRRKVPVWNINSFGEFFLQIMDKYAKDYRAGCDALAAERNRFAADLHSLGIMDVYPSQANYLLCKLKHGSSRRMAEQLLAEHRILIKDLAGKDGIPDGQYVRLAVRDEADDRRLVDALQSLQRNPND